MKKQVIDVLNNQEIIVEMSEEEIADYTIEDKQKKEHSDKIALLQKLGITEEEAQLLLS
jgi:hypothetical protein